MQERSIMAGTEKLEGKNILIVDDEPDVLDSLEQLLSMCHVVKASTFEEAKKALDIQPFDFAILDIMGVDGYALLDLANQKKVIAVMLTAHALNPENIVRSYKEGAASYIPKEKMGEIAVFLSDILEAKEKGKHPWWRWLDRLTESYFEKKFGPDWRNRDEKFWEKFKYDLGH
jgi:DNA-binding NtrC family response regulator